MRAATWHLIHLGQLALSGAALLTIEATAVLPEGRITYADVGLWSDESEAAMACTLEGIRRWSDMPIGIQLNHAGRKASTEVPWKEGAQFAPDDPLGWQTEAPSAIPYADGQIAPVALDREGLRRVRGAFAASAARAAKLGIDLIQLHVAHGYLMHQFLSPLSNRRDDEYGGSLENRMRFPLEIFEAVRAAFPAEKPISVRVSATDWVGDGWDIEQTIVFAEKLDERGCDAIHISRGSISSVFVCSECIVSKLEATPKLDQSCEVGFSKVIPFVLIALTDVPQSRTKAVTRAGRLAGDNPFCS
jgi:2,4-dienoyl-CoA reductase-like NADH-dependent reductase (Old Yellow Enzyme family)